MMASACTVIGGLWRRPGTRPGRRRPSAGARVSIELSPVGYLEIDEPRTPGFREHFGRGFHCSFLCLHWKRILETNGGRTAPGFRENQPPCFPARFPVRRERRFSKRSAGGAPGFKTIEPRFSVFLPFSIGTRFSEPPGACPELFPGACPELMIGQGGFPSGRGLRHGLRQGENRGSPRRPRSSHRYRVDTPIPADFAAASRDSPWHSAVTTARAVGVVNLDGRPPGLRRTAMIEPPNLSPPPFFHRL